MTEREVDMERATVEMKGNAGYVEIRVPGPEADKAAGGQEAMAAGHARLAWSPEGLTITDLGGRQRLVVNGEALLPQQPMVIATSATIEIAGVSLAWRPGEKLLATQQEGAPPARTYVLGVETPGWTREVRLVETVIRLGRAEENDLVINNPGVSRHHARLERRENSYEIVDEESTYGLLVDGQPVTSKVLDDGDRVQIADDVFLAFQIVGEPGEKPGAAIGGAEAPSFAAAAPARGAPKAGAETSHINMVHYLEGDERTVPAVTRQWVTGTPHLVVHVAGRTSQALLSKAYLTIGRGDDNDIVIPDSSVSRRHATIERDDNAFFVADAGSANGVWVGRQRVERRQLQSGDVVSVGRAKLVFKGGFSRDDLTLIETPTIDGKRTRRPVVFVPGLGGSELWLGNERIYPVPSVLFSNPEVLRLPGDNRIEARRIVSDVVIVPGLFKQEQYSRLGDYLENGMGYARGRDLLEFAYDWRQDIRASARQLAEAIDQWHPRSPVTIIAHSLGTLVTRYYVERLGGKRSTERIILMGGPHYGTPKALLVILVGPSILPFGLGDERLRRVMAYYPTSYQILPVYPSVFDQMGQQIDLLRDESWLPEKQRPYLRLAQEFRRELGYRSSVPCISIFGYGYETAVRAQIERRSDGRWSKVNLVNEVAGDLSVPAGSAVLQNSEIHPVYQEHGALYVDNDVKMRLKVELTRSTTLRGGGWGR